MGNSQKHRYDDQHSQMMAVDTAQTISQGDICWLNTDDVRRASQLTYGASEAITQQDFADVFCGVAQDASASGSTKEIRVATGGVFEFTITSATFEIGDLVTVEKASGSALEDQTVQTTTDKGAAIGRIVHAEDSATQVLVEIAPQYRGRYPAALNNTIGATKYVFIPLGTLRLESGADILTSGTVAPIRAQNSGVNPVIKWDNSGGGARIPVAFMAQLPHDYDSTQDVLSLKSIWLDSGSTDTVTLALEAFRITKNPAGILDWTADLGPDAATLTKGTAQPQLASHDLSSNSAVEGDTFAFVLTPGAHTTDDIFLHSLYLQYEQR